MLQFVVRKNDKFFTKNILEDIALISLPTVIIARYALVAGCARFLLADSIWLGKTGDYF